MCIVGGPALQTIAGRKWNDPQTLLAKGGHSWSYRLVLGLVFIKINPKITIIESYFSLYIVSILFQFYFGGDRR